MSAKVWSGPRSVANSAGTSCRNAPSAAIDSTRGIAMTPFQPRSRGVRVRPQSHRSVRPRSSRTMRGDDEHPFAIQLEQIRTLDVVGLAFERLKYGAEMNPLGQIGVCRTI